MNRVTIYASCESNGKPGIHQGPDTLQRKGRRLMLIRFDRRKDGDWPAVLGNGHPPTTFNIAQQP
jgi:hypothetical protein